MNFETIWNEIQNSATSQAIFIQTDPQSKQDPLWFKVVASDSALYIDNASDRAPSVSLSSVRKIPKTEFMLAAEYYERWKSDEWGIRQQVRELSMNSSYIFGLISNFSK